MPKKFHADANLWFIDGLRAVAALYVVLHHAVEQYYDLDVHGLTGIKMLSMSFFFQGRLAVDLFIVLSGYCLMLPVIKAGYHLRGGSWQFYKRRIIRILPPYYLAMALSLLLICFFIGEKTGTHWDASIPVNYNDIITHIWLIHDFSIKNAWTINHAFWSISVECRIYLFFPMIIYLWTKTGSLYTVLSTILLSVIMYFGLVFLKGFYPDVNLLSPGVNPYIILFSLGVLAAHCSFSANSAALWKKLPWGAFFIATFLAYAIAKKLIAKYNIGVDSLTYELLDLLFGSGCFFLIVICSNANSSNKLNFNWLKNMLSWQPLVFLGSFAYSIYLIHAPLIQVLTQYLVAPLHLSRYNSAIVLLILCFVIIIPLAYGFFLLCEKPFIKWGKRLNIKQTETAVVLNPAP